jgi:hypothetical protein
MMYYLISDIKMAIMKNKRRKIHQNKIEEDSKQSNIIISTLIIIIIIGISFIELTKFVFSILSAI